jgi:ribosomal protein S27E
VAESAAAGTPTLTGESTKVRCFNCQHTQQVPVSLSSYECEECGQRLQRKAAS